MKVAQTQSSLLAPSFFVLTSNSLSLKIKKSQRPNPWAET